MKHSIIFSALLGVMVVFGVFSCKKDTLINPPQAVQQLGAVDDRASGKCFNFRVEGVADLGCACLPVPFDCGNELPEMCNFGAMTFPAKIGKYEGYMTSIVTILNESGNPDPTLGNGAYHLNLIHYFVTEDGQSAFWTDDQAVCAPGSNFPTTCIVNDVLNIVGGCGDFEGASGKFHNHGVLTFGPPVLCDVFYSPDPQYVYTGTVEFELFGRICGPNL